MPVTSPSDAAEDVCTTRPTSARAAARTTVAAPSTLARYIAPRSRRQSSLTPATL